MVLGPATKIKIHIEWVYLSYRGEINRGLKLNPIEFDGSVPADQQLELTTYLNFLNDDQLNVFKTYYLIVTFNYFDKLTNKMEKIVIFNRQYHELGSTDPIVLKLLRLNLIELKLIQSYIEKNH